MRNHVSKVFVGTATANVSGTGDLGPVTCPAGGIIAYDYDTGGSLVATSKNIGFAYADVLGEPIVAGPIAKDRVTEAIVNPYKAQVNKKVTMTVGSVPADDVDCIFKVTYHDNLSIIPNQIKQTVIAIKSDGVNNATTTTWATAIAAEFNKQLPGGQLFCTVTTATNTVIFEGITLSTESNYNDIDRPEVLNFEIGYPIASLGNYSDSPGVYTQALTTALVIGQGSPAKTAWVESQAIGRQGFSDRRMWNDTKKYKSKVKAGETYANLVITADHVAEGDMQGVRFNPIGVNIFGDSATVATLVTDLTTAGVVPKTVA